jgi:hypothetical protein
MSFIIRKIKVMAVENIDGMAACFSARKKK